MLRAREWGELFGVFIISFAFLLRSILMHHCTTDLEICIRKWAMVAAIEIPLPWFWGAWCQLDSGQTALFLINVCAQHSPRCSRACSSSSPFRGAGLEGSAFSSGFFLCVFYFCSSPSLRVCSEPFHELSLVPFLLCILCGTAAVLHLPPVPSASPWPSLWHRDGWWSQHLWSCERLEPGERAAPWFITAC